MSDPSIKPNSEPPPGRMKKTMTWPKPLPSMDEAQRNRTIGAPNSWPWASDPDDFVCVSEVDSDGEGTQKKQVWSRAIIEHYEAVRRGGAGSLVQCEVISPYPTIIRYQGPPNLEDTLHGQFLKMEFIIHQNDVPKLEGVFTNTSANDSSHGHQIDQGSHTLEDHPQLALADSHKGEHADSAQMPQTTSNEGANETPVSDASYRATYEENTVFKGSEFWKEYCNKQWPDGYILPPLQEQRVARWNKAWYEEGERCICVKKPGTICKGRVAASFLDLEPFEELATSFLRPKIVEFWPVNLLPDQLVVLDPYGQLTGPDSERLIGKPVKYRRAWLEDDRKSFDREDTSATLRIGHVIGTGNHSKIVRGTWSLPDGLVTRVGSFEVSLAVKQAHFNSDDLGHLEREARAYLCMSLTTKNMLQMEHTGYIVSDDEFYGIVQRQFRKNEQPTISPACAVVPKFYGYYAPDGDLALSPLLLIEDCGKCVYDFKASGEYWSISAEERRSFDIALTCQVPSMYALLCKAGFVRSSVKWENVTVQPGPLWNHPDERSYSTPSFRIIDFGRTTSRFEATQDGDSELSWDGSVFLRHGSISNLSTFNKKAKADIKEALYLVENDWTPLKDI